MSYTSKSRSRFMRFPISTLAFLCALIPIFSCGPSRKLAGTEHRIMDTLVVSARNNPMEIYRAATPRVWEIVHTGVTLGFDFAAREAHGVALLSIMPYNAATDSLILDAKGMTVKSVSAQVSGEGTPIALPYQYSNDQLRVNVSTLSFGDIKTKQLQTIRIEYSAQPYATPVGGSAAITEDRGLYFINTDGRIPGKPVQIWTQGETESNSHWMPTIDKPNQRSTFDIALIVPDTMQTLSNGQLVSSSPAGVGLRRDEWRMSQPIQIYAAMFAIGRFAIAKDDWKDAQGQSHEVSYYTEPQFAGTSRGMFKNTVEMIGYFSKMTGVSYPWNKYSQVVVRDYVSGAMENTTASLFGEFTNKNSRQLLDESNEDIVAHELFHQWFGDYVTAESWSNLTLNESFATYGELLWRRHKYGQASSDESALNSLQRYLATTDRADPPLVRYYYRSREEMFDRVSYQKGGIILRYINSLIGDTLFSAAMEHYLRGNALQSAEAAQWRLAIETVTGQDWTQFFNQWYYRGGHPVLNIRHSYDDAAGMLRVSIQQVTSPDSNYRYILPLKTAIISEEGIRYEDWTIKDRRQTFNIPYQNGKRPVAIPDVLHVLPAEIKEEKPLESWLTQLQSSKDYISKRLAIDMAFTEEGKPPAPKIIEWALKDTLRGVRLYTMQRLPSVNRQAWKEALLPQIKYLLATDGNNKVRGAALSILGAWKERSEIPAMIAATSDSSYLVAGAALQSLVTLTPDTAYEIANRVLPTNPKSALQAAAWKAITSKGNSQDMQRFESAALTVYGGEKVTLANNLQQYALAVKDNALYERILKLLTDLTQQEPIRGYRYAIGSDIFELRETYRKKPDATRLALADRFATQILQSEAEEENKKKYKAIGKPIP
jgi:aminopeptidase N